MKYLHIRITDLLEEKGISKTRICKDLELQRGNFNRYCRDDFQRVDAALILKLCDYFHCEIADQLEIRDDRDRFPAKDAGTEEHADLMCAGDAR